MSGLIVEEENVSVFVHKNIGYSVLLINDSDPKNLRLLKVIEENLFEKEHARLIASFYALKHNLNVFY